MEIAQQILGMFLLGAGVGLISAALGVGGGVLMVPAFVTFAAGMDMNTAKGTSLFIILFVAAANSWRMNRGDMKSPWPVIGYLAVGSLIGAYTGGWITTLLTDNVVSWVFIALLTFVAIRTFFLKRTIVLQQNVRKRNTISIIV